MLFWNFQLHRRDPIGHIWTPPSLKSVLVCKERATEICLKLKDELTSEINRLKQEVANRDAIISDLEQKHARYEEGLSKALMRGVCALNMEAMSVLNNPDFNGKSVRVESQAQKSLKP